MKRISASNLIKYNANSRGSNVGDCAIRSVSLALDEPYTQSSKGLKEFAKTYNSKHHTWGTWHEMHFNSTANIADYLESKCPNVKNIACRSENITVGEFADEHLSGTYLLVAESKSSGRSHAVCCIDGDVYDTWDCRDWFVKEYFVIRSRKSKRNLEHVKEDALDELEYEGTVLGEELFQKYLEKYKIQEDGDYTFKTYIYDDSVLVFRVKFHDIILDADFHFSIKISLPLGKSVDELRSYIKKSIKTKMYDRMYSIGKDIEARYATINSMTDEDKEFMKDVSHWRSRMEDRFFRGLPGWVKPLVTSVYVRSKGPREDAWHDDYELTFLPVASDPNRDLVTLIGYQPSDIKLQLDIYHDGYGDLDKFSRPGEDYNEYDYI